MSKPAAHGWLPGSAAVGVGALTVVQSRINGQLGAELGNGFLAAWISFFIGLVFVVVVVVVGRRQREAFARLRIALRRGEGGTRLLRPWYLFGGLGGATFVAAQSSTVQYLGVAIFTVAVVAAQNANSLVVDQLGLGPHGVQRVSAIRVVAALVATLGVGVAVAGQFSGNQSFVVSALAFALFAGALIAIQQAINGRVAVAAGSPWIAGLANFVVGWLGLSLALLIIAVTGNFSINHVPSLLSQPYIYLGGFIGVAFIVVAAVVVRSLGVLLFALLSIAGQMLGALLIDWLVPEGGRPVTWQLVSGVAITGGAVAVATLSRRQT